MYARSTTIRAHPQFIDQGLAVVRDEVLPLVQRMDGFVGLSMLADRDSGRCIVTTAWETEDAMRASAEAVKASRARAAEVLGGEVEVRQWEIAVLHRRQQTPDGARTRVIWGHSEPGQTDRLLDTFRASVLPKVEEISGFCSVSMMVDRPSGRTALAVAYESREAMERANEQASRLRQEASREMGMQIDEIAEFDLLLAHLRVPETV
jgi:heme-degrading monooxygenase HmoA